MVIGVNLVTIICDIKLVQTKAADDDTSYQDLQATAPQHWTQRSRQPRCRDRQNIPSSLELPHPICRCICPKIWAAEENSLLVRITV